MGEVATLPADGREMTTAEIMQRVIMEGDLSRLTAEEKTSYYLSVCKSTGLNPMTQPFAYVKLSGKEVLYARKDCADQLRHLHGVSLKITDKQVSDDLLLVEVQATNAKGRTDTDLGVVPYVYPDTFRNPRTGQWQPHPKAGRKLEGEDAANALLKCVTKAKRRVTLSLAGLGLLDETEVEAALAAEALADAPARAHVGPPRTGLPAPPADRQQPQAPPKDRRPAPEPIRVAMPGAEPAVEFARNKSGLRAALELIGTDPAALVLLNLPLLDNAASLPEWADYVAELRGRAAEALAPADDAVPWPGADAGAEQPEPEPDEPGAGEPDPAGDAMRAHKGELPADAEPRDVFGLPPYRGDA